MIYWSIRFRDSFGTDKTSSVTSAFLLGTINYWDYQGFVLFMPVGLTITNKQVTEIEWETGPRDWRVA
jgi:hypothetical protein